MKKRNGYHSNLFILFFPFVLLSFDGCIFFKDVLVCFLWAKDVAKDMNVWISPNFH